MAISAEKRASLPSSAFAYPKTRSYPIDTLARAKNALARANQSGTSGTYRHVAAAVRRKWGSKVASVSRKKGSLSPPSRAARSKRPSAALKRTYAARRRRAATGSARRRSSPSRASSRRSGRRPSRSGSIRRRR